MVPLTLALWFAFCVVAPVTAAATHYWCTHRRRPRIVFSSGAALLDARTTAVLRALDDLPLGQAHAVLWSIMRLIDATSEVSTLWPDAADMTAGAAVARAAARAPSPPPRPRLVPPA